jgi:hypothetical protein
MCRVRITERRGRERDTAKGDFKKSRRSREQRAEGEQDVTLR